MTTGERIDGLRTAAGSAGDAAQVEVCDRALAGDADAIASCLAVCREAEVNRIDIDTWSQNAQLGDYLAEYWEGERDDGSRCGWDDSGLAQIRRKLALRGLTLAADDCGLRAVEAQS